MSNFIDLTAVDRTTLPPWAVNHGAGALELGDIGYSEENTITSESKMMSRL